MDTQKEPRQSPGEPRLRRRVVFELTAEELPLLAEAEERHGSKRSALVAALRAAAGAKELEARLAAAEAKLARQPKAAERNRRVNEGEEAERLRAKLRAAEEAGASLQAQLDQAARGGEERDAEAEAERRELEEDLADCAAELRDLAERAVDAIYCERCGSWAAPSQWQWQAIEGGGSYAYHRPCGDHGPGIIGGASWLARRERG